MTAGTRTSVAADAQIEWVRDLAEGRRLVMEREGIGYRAMLSGFRGVGSTQEIALDDLLAHMRAYFDASVDFARSLEPGGLLHEKLRKIDQMVDLIVGRRARESR
jgi:hypothetical protein